MSLWDALEGSRIAGLLADQIASGSVPHAWLFIGPPGSGKRKAALALAAALNCPVKPGSGCGDCSTCQRIERARHPDVHHIVPEGPLIPVDVIRESVVPESARSPFEAARKVFIIEEAERMNDAAQNALLKTLEEPQPDTVFVLISDRETELLETVRSRCRVVRFEPGIEKEMPDDSALLRARTWVSFPRRLLSPVDAFAVAGEISEVVKEFVKEREVTQKEEVVELAEAMGEGRGTAAARNALAKRHKRELRRLEENLLAEALGSLAGWYRDVLAVRTGAIEAVLNRDQLDELGKWAPSDVTDAALVAAMERCITARASLVKNANAALAVESALVELARLVPPPLGAVT